MPLPHIKYDKATGKLTAFGRDIVATNTVRNEINGLRTPSEVVYSERKDGSKGKPYYPRSFPIGNWTVTGIVPHGPTEPYLYPFFIRTDAHQIVKVFKLDPASKTPKIGVVEGMEEDYGYGLHFSSSSTTMGCIKIVKKDDLLWLVENINAAMTSGEKVRLEVV